MVRDDHVDVTYRERGKREQLSADYCLNCIPMHLLAGIPNNFPADYSGAFTQIGRGKLFKLGLQARERFWEREQIYGGISWTAQDITQIWYPAHGIHRQERRAARRVHVRRTTPSDRFANLPPAERHRTRDQPGRKDPSAVSQLHRKRRQRRVAPDEPHARLRRVVERRVVSSNGSRACRRPLATTT